MSDLHSSLAALGVSEGRFVLPRPRPFCLVLEPCVATDRDFLHEDLLAPEVREAFWTLVDDIGLVVVRDARVDPSHYRDVRGRSSRGRLSQGEYFHHDGCSGPTKPRVVEIRCPHQDVARRIPTSVAPFPETVYAMVRELPPSLRHDAELGGWVERLDRDGELPPDQLDHVQGMVTRAIRRGLSASGARAYFLEVDRRCEAYDEPWHMGESRFIANANPTRTMQHRRAYGADPADRRPTGALLKRWPAEEL